VLAVWDEFLGGSGTHAFNGALEESVKHEADGFENLFFVRVIAIGVLDRPRRLHAERGLKIGLG